MRDPRSVDPNLELALEGYARDFVFLESGTWIVPNPKPPEIRVYGCGGGGGGGGGEWQDSKPFGGASSGGGGGAGAYPSVKRVLLGAAIQAGDALKVEIGAGGAGGPPGRDGAAGGASRILSPTGQVLVSFGGANGGRNGWGPLPGYGGRGGASTGDLFLMGGTGSAWGKRSQDGSSAISAQGGSGANSRSSNEGAGGGGAAGRGDGAAGGRDQEKGQDAANNSGAGGGGGGGDVGRKNNARAGGKGGSGYIEIRTGGV
jgi:hypothetical protein